MNSITIEPRRSITLDEIIAEQEKERGVKPMSLEVEALLKRVSDGGHSGEYLALAFNSAYRNEPFNQSLRDIIKLDDEAFRLFHQILHMRHVPGWSDDALYQVEQQILAIKQDSEK